ncbi:major facilitator superfamily transporter [Ceratobasidium sp. AG-Ba]|nr:major facilitator superfamily transporter [Ceratobasidium sp. AG-Ba]
MASTEMESRATLETSVTATPAPSIRHNVAHRESIELATLNYRQSDTTIAPSAAHNATETAAESRREMIALAAVVWTQFMAGWNDGTLGPLIPRIQNYYGLGFITVSMLFVSACIGFITGAILVVHLTDRYGFGRVLITGSAFQIVVYSVLSITPPFPVMCVALMVNGIGMSFQNAQTSAMVISLTKNPGLKMGILQAGYGAGACVAPLIATQFASRPRWSFYYLVSLGLAVTNTISLSYVFRFRRLPEILASFGIPEVVHTAEHSQSNKYRQILGLRVVYILAFFCLVYVGTEVTIGGWIVTFLIDTRGGGASSGYVSSGFFAGLMLGRLALIWVNHKVGERRVIYLYSALIVALEFVIWFTPSLILNAVAVSVVGLLLG